MAGCAAVVTVPAVVAVEAFPTRVPVIFPEALIVVQVSAAVLNGE